MFVNTIVKVIKSEIKNKFNIKYLFVFLLCLVSCSEKKIPSLAANQESRFKIYYEDSNEINRVSSLCVIPTRFANGSKPILGEVMLASLTENLVKIWGKDSSVLRVAICDKANEYKIKLEAEILSLRERKGSRVAVIEPSRLSMRFTLKSKKNEVVIWQGSFFGEEVAFAENLNNKSQLTNRWSTLFDLSRIAFNQSYNAFIKSRLKARIN